MEFTFTPFTLFVVLASLIYLIAVIVLATKGYRKTALWMMAVYLFLAITKPFRLAVDSTPAQVADQMTYDRHHTLPEKVIVKEESFDEVLTANAQRNKQLNNEVKQENLGK